MRKIFSNPEKDYTYQLIASYFDHLSLEKVRDENNFSLYMCRLPCLLLNEQRFLVVMVPKDNFPPTYVQPLDNLKWLSLQTRTLSNEYPDILQQSYQQKQKVVYEKDLKIISRTNQISVYSVQDLPLQVSLLHTRGTTYEYPDEGNLVAALETYRTILQFTNSSSEL